MAEVSSVLERYYQKSIVVECFAVLRPIFCFDKKILFLLKNFPATHLDYLNNVQLPMKKIKSVAALTRWCCGNYFQTHYQITETTVERETTSFYNIPNSRSGHSLVESLKLMV